MPLIVACPLLFPPGLVLILQYAKSDKHMLRSLVGHKRTQQGYAGGSLLHIQQACKLVAQRQSEGTSKKEQPSQNTLCCS